MEMRNDCGMGEGEMDGKLFQGLHTDDKWVTYPPQTLELLARAWWPLQKQSQMSLGL